MTIVIERAPDRGYVLHCEQVLPVPRDEVFPFFADARNLERLTPSSLRFEILTPAPIVMEQGLLIDYRLRIRGVPFTWQSEISAWEPPHRFVDRQTRGPYRWWIHEHTLVPGGPDRTIVRDVVRYGVPGGRIVHALFVRREVRSIFAYRSRMMREIFGSGDAVPRVTAPAGSASMAPATSA